MRKRLASIDDEEIDNAKGEYFNGRYSEGVVHRYSEAAAELFLANFCYINQYSTVELLFEYVLCWRFLWSPVHTAMATRCIVRLGALSCNEYLAFSTAGPINAMSADLVFWRRKNITTAAPAHELSV